MQEFREEFKVKSEEIIEKIKELIHEGNINRIIIKDEEGKVFLEIPVTYGLIGVLLAPWLAAIGAVAAITGNLKIEVIRTGEPSQGDKPHSQGEEQANQE